MNVQYVLNKSELDKYANMLEEMDYGVIRVNESTFKAYDAKGKLKRIVKVRKE